MMNPALPDEVEGQLQHDQEELPSPPPSNNQTHLAGMMSLPLRSANSTPASRGLFSSPALRPAPPLPQPSASEGTSPAALGGSPYLHPLQTHKVRETHKALIDSNNITGRKLINQYEVIEEIGRGMHGKVKLAKNLETGENVAIKIIPRFSKKRRLGKVTAMSPQDKTKKEIAILKKIRHPNVVALLEVIDDPELKKIYMVLEHVELGEIVWRKKGLPHICHFERRRVEREMRGEPPSVEEEKYEQFLERRQALKELKRAKMAQHYQGKSDFWSHEYGAGDESGSSYGQYSRISSKEDFAFSDNRSYGNSRPSSRAPSRSQSIASIHEDIPLQVPHDIDWEDDMETPGVLGSKSNSGTALNGTAYGGYQDDRFYRGRSPSMADSIISHMSSVDFTQHPHDAFADDFSYVPCFTLPQARSAFRDTVLGLEYLHYQGVVHRDIKPANLLWSKDHRVKISDFGVSYFGRPIREGELGETVSESEAQDFDNDLELAKTVGTPAFFAPELCYTDLDIEQPKVSEQIDVWSLGVTLFCLVFARIPFLAEDEFQMFRKIATEDVYIPQRRLKPVDPSTSPIASSLFKRQNADPYRDDNDLDYEDVDPSLYDLLQLMLCKNPEKRIRLRDIKRHPWVIQDMNNPVGWIDDTEPARVGGRKIQVNEREMSFAVVPLTFLERARSAVKKTIDKVMHPLMDRSDSVSRNRASSSAASSAGESMVNHVPATPQARLDRRPVEAPDDYFSAAKVKESESTSTPNAYDPMATMLAPDRLAGNVEVRPNSVFPLLRQESDKRPHSRNSGFVAQLYPPRTETTPTSSHGADGQEYVADMRNPRGLLVSSDEISRSRSVDSVSKLKLAQAQVGVDTVVASAHIQTPRHPRSIKSVDLSRARLAHGTLSSMPVSPFSPSRTPHPLHHHRYDSEPSSFNDVSVPERAQTAQDVERPIMNTASLLCAHDNSQPTLLSTPGDELEHHQRQSEVLSAAAGIPCPASPLPEDAILNHRAETPPVETVPTSKSSSTESMNILGTPLTSPSEMTSPVVPHQTKNTSDFQSDPSLPALLSGASSISADLEGELLGQPGVVSARPSLLETTDSLTPPAFTKEPTDGFPLHGIYEHNHAKQSGQLNSQYEIDKSRTPTTATSHDDNGGDDEDNDNSDDEILLMAKSKKRPFVLSIPSPSRYDPKRRDTNFSTASDETAKKDPAYSAKHSP